MEANLRVERLGTQALSELLTEGGLLPTEVESQWLELLCFLVACQVAKNVEGVEASQYAGAFFRRLKQEGAMSVEAREELFTHRDDIDYLQKAARKRLEDVVRTIGQTFGISGACTLDQQGFSCQFTEHYQWSVVFSDPQQQTELVDLSVTLRGLPEAPFEVFGPMLAGLVFGKVREGQSGMFRSAKREVCLSLPNDSEQGAESAAAALIRLARLAEASAPAILKLP